MVSKIASLSFFFQDDDSLSVFAFVTSGIRRVYDSVSLSISIVISIVISSAVISPPRLVKNGVDFCFQFLESGGLGYVAGIAAWAAPVCL